MFFVNDLLLAIYVYFRLRKLCQTKSKFKQFSFSSSKWVVKQQRQLCNINNAFGPGTANECTEQCWFKKFYEGDKSLEDEERSGRPLEVDNEQLRAIIEADHLTTKQEVGEELNVDCSMIIRHLKQIGKVKKLSKWVPHELSENLKKIVTLKCCLLLFYATATF